MVKKLFKHEILAWLRVWIPMQIILLGISVVNRLIWLIGAEGTIYTIVKVSSSIACGVAIIAAFALPFIFGIVRFYKNLFSCEGYLTFTLPVTTNQHISVKLITAFMFSVLSVLLILVSGCIVSSGDLLVEIVKAAIFMLKDIYSIIGLNLVFYIIEVIIIILLTIMTQYLLYYSCISIGQTFKKNRVIGAVVVYFVYYAITQVLSTVLVIIISTGIIPMNMIGLWAETHMTEFVHITFCATMVLEVILNVLYYCITRYFIHKKLNLE